VKERLLLGSSGSRACSEVPNWTEPALRLPPDAPRLAGYPERAMLLYDGLHYDALAVAAFKASPICEQMRASLYCLRRRGDYRAASASCKILGLALRRYSPHRRNKNIPRPAIADPLVNELRSHCLARASHTVLCHALGILHASLRFLINSPLGEQASRRARQRSWT
jgi:hypothetical protein